jgi:hypothetical protein
MPDLMEVFDMVSQKVEPDLDSWNQQERRQRRAARNRKLGAFAVVAAIAAVAGIVSVGALRSDDSKIPGAGGELTTDTLVGIWAREAGARFVKFNPDGTFAADDHKQLLYSGTSAATGTYELVDGTITFTTNGRSSLCRPNETWVWEARLIGNNRLRALVVDDATADCQMGLGLEWTWTRLDA